MAITLKAMTYFNAALTHGNIAKAAAELNIAASAVANAIDQVEAEFDLTLVSRQRARGISANASGHQIAARFARLLEDYQSVMASGADLKSALTGTLRIGYYAPIAPAFLPTILQKIAPPEGNVTLHLEACDNTSAQDGLLSGAYDAILFVSEDLRPAVDFDVLIEAPAYCLAPEDHPFARAGQVTIAQIAREPLVVLDRPVAGAYYQSLFDTQPGKPTIAAYATSTEMVRSLVAAGHGCAVLNMQPLTRQSYGGDGLACVPIEGELPPLTLSIGYDKSRPRRLVQHFVDATRAYFRTHAKAQDLIVTTHPQPQQNPPATD